VRLAQLWGARLCPNYVLASSALAQSPRDLYIAHEVAQMTPVTGHRLHAALLLANDWARAYLPQAHCHVDLEPEVPLAGAARWLQGLGEWALGGRLGDALERWEQGRKRRKFAAAARQSEAAQLDSDRVKGHFVDHGRPVLAAYARRLAEAGLTG
jgi:hypothetical protein